MIIDTNCANLVFGVACSPEFEPILNSLYKQEKVVLNYGGTRYIKEMTEATRTAIARLDRNGKAVQSPVNDVDSKEKDLIDGAASLGIQSNDQHILALALVSGSRLLCTHDQDLHADFTNPRILSSPRGKIYQNRSHIGLINSLAKKGL